jgi:hypothetical protein
MALALAVPAGTDVDRVPVAPAVVVAVVAVAVVAVPVVAVALVVVES